MSPLSQNSSLRLSDLIVEYYELFLDLLLAVRASTHAYPAAADLRSYLDDAHTASNLLPPNSGISWDIFLFSMTV